MIIPSFWPHEPEPLLKWKGLMLAAWAAQIRVCLLLGRTSVGKKVQVLVTDGYGKGGELQTDRSANLGIIDSKGEGGIFNILIKED